MTMRTFFFPPRGSQPLVSGSRGLEDTTYQGPFLRLYETNCLDVAEISASGESKTT